MRRLAPSAVIAILALAGLPALAADPDSDATARKSVQQSLLYLAEEGQWWIDEKKCASCHHTGYLIWSYQLADSRGFSIDRAQLDHWSSWTIGHLLSLQQDEKGNYLEGVIGKTNVEGLAQVILGASPAVAEQHRKEFGDFRELIRVTQEKDNSWKPGGQLPSQKRPEAETRAVSTMGALLALDAMGGDDTRDRALTYLREDAGTPSKSTEHAAMNLIVAGRFGDDSEAAEALTRLLARQNPDGGWSWVDGEPSDPMATGQALFGLGEAGVDLDAFRSALDHGRRFLSRTQREDGSWETASTKTKNNGKSSRISDFYGSAWAVIGLCRTLPEKRAAAYTAR